VGKPKKRTAAPPTFEGLVSLKTSEEQRRAWVEAAQRDGRTLSSWLRHVADVAAAASREVPP
jgi:hypothetical protein